MIIEKLLLINQKIKTKHKIKVNSFIILVLVVVNLIGHEALGVSVYGEDLAFTKARPFRHKHFNGNDSENKILRTNKDGREDYSLGGVSGVGEVNGSHVMHVADGGKVGEDQRRLTKRSPGLRMYDDNVQSYLTSFGYLPESSLHEMGNLRSEDELVEAVKTLQTFGRIPATGVLDDATINLMKKPRCGLPDNAVASFKHTRRKRYTLQGQKWQQLHLTWSLRTEKIRNSDRGWIRAELNRSLEVWSKQSKLTFREVNSDHADILIYFLTGDHKDGYTFDGPGKVLAHAFFPGKDMGGDVHFDADETWLLLHSDPDADGTRLFSVAVHEFGHSLGLAHSSVLGSLMYPWYQPINESNWRLPDDDTLAIQWLYGAPEKKLWDQNPYHNYPKPDHNNITPRHHKPPPVPTTHAPPPPSPKTPTPERPKPSTSPSPPSHPDKTNTRHWGKPGWRETPKPNSPPPFHPTWHPPYSKTPKFTEKPVRVSSTHWPPFSKAGGKPNICDTTYDAITVIRREMYVFKDKWFWRIGENGLYPGFPVQIERFWPHLPRNFSRIDAVYERFDYKIVFFIGRQYFMYEGAVLLPDYPKPISSLGLPEDLDHIDGATVWGHNSKTYLFSGNKYWKLDEEAGRIELDYPRDMRFWKGVDYNIDDVFLARDGKTYFFKGKGYWKFDDGRMKVENEEQIASSQFWMECPKIHDGDSKNGTSSFGSRRRNQSPNESGTTSSWIGKILVSGFVILVLSIALTILFYVINKHFFSNRYHYGSRGLKFKNWSNVYV